MDWTIAERVTGVPDLSRRVTGILLGVDAFWASALTERHDTPGFPVEVNFPFRHWLNSHPLVEEKGALMAPFR
jgi:hypothetical protein